MGANRATDDVSGSDENPAPGFGAGVSHETALASSGGVRGSERSWGGNGASQDGRASRLVPTDAFALPERREAVTSPTNLGGGAQRKGACGRGGGEMQKARRNMRGHTRETWCRLLSEDVGVREESVGAMLLCGRLPAPAAQNGRLTEGAAADAPRLAHLTSWLKGPMPPGCRGDACSSDGTWIRRRDSPGRAARHA